MTHKEALAIEELAEALGWPCESVEYEFAIQVFIHRDHTKTKTPIVRYKAKLGLDREVFDHYDAAMAYLQALGVRDD